MNVTPAQQRTLDAKKKAVAAPDDQALSDFHAEHIACVEAALLEAAKRREAAGDPVTAMRFKRQYYALMAIHTESTALAMELGLDVGVRSGER